MPTRLTDLPQEIRDMLWSELLLVGNRRCLCSHLHYGLAIAKQDRWKEPWGVCSSLFTVNKAVSADALAFFYRENAFVLTENWTIRFVDSLIPWVIPPKRVWAMPSSPPLPKFALRIGLRQGVNKATIGGSDAWEEIDNYANYGTSMALIPGHYLPKLIQMINGIRSPLCREWRVEDTGVPIYRIELDFKTSTEPYYQDTVVSERLVGCLKGLRQFQVFGRAVFAGESYLLPEHNDFVSNNWPVFRTDFSVTGLNEDLVNGLLQGSNLPVWTIESTLAEARRLISNAKILEDGGNYSAAYGDLRLSEFIIGFPRYQEEFPYSAMLRPRRLEVTTIFFDILIAYDKLAWNLCWGNCRSLLGPNDGNLKNLGREIRGIFGRCIENYSPLSPFNDDYTHADLDDVSPQEMKASLSKLYVTYSRYIFEQGFARKAYDAVKTWRRTPGTWNCKG